MPTVEKLWEEFASQLRGFIRSRVRDHAAAEDILQEVFLKIHRKLPTLRSGERLESWIWRITRNAVADHFRALPPEMSFVEKADSGSENETELPDLRPCIRKFVAQLAPSYREALLLTDWRGLTQEQMAVRLGLSVSGAKSRVQRARSQIKKLLLSCCRLEIDRRGNVLEMEPRNKGSERCLTTCGTRRDK